VNKVEVKAIHSDVTKDINRYIHKKISKLDSFIPRQVRRSAHAEVRLSESKSRDKKQCTAEVNLYLPGEVIAAKETTVNMYAAVDIVEEKLKAQLRKYKSTHSVRQGHRNNQVRAFLGKIIRKKSAL
jgi:putative sigma-54 modulation protein